MGGRTGEQTGLLKKGLNNKSKCRACLSGLQHRQTGEITTLRISKADRHTAKTLTDLPGYFHIRPKVDFIVQEGKYIFNHVV